MPGPVAQYLQDLRQQAIMREESEAIDRSDPQIREWNSRILDEAFWQGSSDAQGNKPHAYENRTAPIDPEIKAAYEEGREQWQRDQLSHLSTPELHDRWVSAVREYWDKCESLDYWNGYFSADDHAAELEAQTKLIYTEMNKPERAADLHELEQAPPWIEQSVEHYSSLSTPDLHALWQQTSSEFWVAMDASDYRQGSPFAAHHVEELQAHANLIRAQLDTPERAAEAYALDHHGHQLEQGLSY